MTDQRSIAGLLDLQELDLSIDRVRGRLEELHSGGEVGEARARQIQAEDALGRLKLEIDDVSREQRRLENDVESLGLKIDAERKRLYDGSVANAKELQAIDHEVEALTHRRARMEDALLEVMERREAIESPLSQLEAEVEEARQRTAEIEASAGVELVDLERALLERQRERASMVSAFEPEVLGLYEDLRRQKKGVGAVALTDGVCQGCHQKLSAVYLDRLKRQEGIRRCEYCRRILVFA